MGGCENIPQRGLRDEREINTKYKKISVKSQKKKESQPTNGPY
jgi:hypothetical protein